MGSKSGLILVGEGSDGSSFCLLPRVPRGFHFESSIIAGDQSQLNSSDEVAAR